MAKVTQENRHLAVKTPLGDDVLLLTEFSGREELSRLFSFQLTMYSEKHAIPPADLVGKAVSFGVLGADDTPRPFHGFVSRLRAGGLESGLRQYRAEVVPWLWFLTRTADCRIFQGKSVPDIIDRIFKDLGFSDYEMNVQGSHPPREYCVQYRETDFNFVSRLMEEEGIFYYFRHEANKHTLVMVDKKSAYPWCPEREVRFTPDVVVRWGLPAIHAWEHQYEFRSGKWAQTDYNFITPSLDLMANTNTLVSLNGNGKFELYDYPGGHGKPDEGKNLSKIRMEEEEVPHDVVSGQGSCRTFFPGGKFKLVEHEVAEEGKTYVLTGVEHHAHEPADFTRTGKGEAVYENRFTAIPDSVTFRPDRVTPKPTVKGCQTAVVVGPGGEEIFTDSYGRVKVQFFWDREGKKDENSSCWIRVAQNWAGKQWGIVFNPRIGQEVIVDFLEGDPDRPIIVGRVYNAEQMPPYALPGEQTKSTIKTRSSKGGSPANFNEIRFEDKKGSEQLFIHAEKNQDIEVENDETHWVGHDRAKTIDHDETTHVKHDRTETVDNNETITVHANRTEQVDINETITIGANRTRTVMKNEVITVALTRTHTVGINEAITVGAAQEITVGAFQAITVGANQTNTIGASRSVTVGGSQTIAVSKNETRTIGDNETVTIGKKLAIEAGEEISIKTGKALLLMKKDGTIHLKGKDITIEASGEMVQKASKDIVMKGKKILQN